MKQAVLPVVSQSMTTYLTCCYEANSFTWLVSQSIMTYLTCFYEANSFTCSFTIN